MTASIEVQIYWIRHGFSCANVLKELTNRSVSVLENIVEERKIHDSRSRYAGDSKLPDSTISGMCKINKHVATHANKTDDQYQSLLYTDICKTCDYYMCSELTRAMETSMLLFRDCTDIIYVVPYILEKRNAIAEHLNMDRDNIPSDFDTQLLIKKNFLNEHPCGTDYLPSLDLGFVKLFIDESGKPYSTASLDNFLKKIVPAFINPDKKILKLAIVSHSHFIQEVTGVKHIGNLDIVLQRLNVTYTSSPTMAIKSSNQISAQLIAKTSFGKFKTHEYVTDRCGREFNTYLLKKKISTSSLQ